MNSSLRRIAAMLTAAFALSGGLAAALAHARTADIATSHVVKTVGGEVFTPNVSDSMTMHFAPGNITVRTGDTIVFEHADRTHEPHTISVVAARDLPRTSTPCPVCDRFAKAHFPHGRSAPPVAVVNVGRLGLDRPGDSLLWMSGRISTKVTAPAGTVLHYFCAAHPWMQGTIKVVK